jgi:glycosyltransferase involved in cell wall biosynthesis
MREYAAGVPAFVAETVVAAAAERGESTLIVAEDWQTAPAAIATDSALSLRGLREHATLLWNANNTYGFEEIDWPALERAARITTVSRYMKFELTGVGIDPLVIPNGIPARLSARAEPLARSAAELFSRRPLFVKVARFDEDKRWMQAIDGFAILRERRPGAMLVTRGGREPYGNSVFAHARALGIDVQDLAIDAPDALAVLKALSAAHGSIVNVRSFVPEDALLALFRVADAVLANSGREPFGLVGLEVMAVGGVAVTGSTGEEYARPFENAIVCDTADPRELAASLDALCADLGLAKEIRANAEATARRYTWPHVLEILSRKLELNL